MVLTTPKPAVMLHRAPRTTRYAEWPPSGYVLPYSSTLLVVGSVEVAEREEGEEGGFSEVSAVILGERVLGRGLTGEKTR